MKDSIITRHSTWILDYIRPFPDFPARGVKFQWYSPLLRDPKAFRRAIQELAERYRQVKIDLIAGIDSRGFLFCAPLAYELGVPFILIRKKGKLPGNVEQISYTSEYGQSFLEIENDSVKSKQKVLVIDDVVAVGGTAAAACVLVERLGAEVVEVACLIELPKLNGRQTVARPMYSLLAVN